MSTHPLLAPPGYRRNVCQNYRPKRKLSLSPSRFPKPLPPPPPYPLAAEFSQSRAKTWERPVLSIRHTTSAQQVNNAAGAAASKLNEFNLIVADYKLVSRINELTDGMMDQAEKALKSKIIESWKNKLLAEQLWPDCLEHTYVPPRQKDVQEVIVTKTIEVPTSNFNYVGRIMGPAGIMQKLLSAYLGCSIKLRTEFYNAPVRSRQYFIVQSKDQPERADIKVENAVIFLNYMLTSPNREDYTLQRLKDAQLELVAIMDLGDVPDKEAKVQKPINDLVRSILASKGVSISVPIEDIKRIYRAHVGEDISGIDIMPPDDVPLKPTDKSNESVMSKENSPPRVEDKDTIEKAKDVIRKEANNDGFRTKADIETAKSDNNLNHDGADDWALEAETAKSDENLNHDGADDWAPESETVRPLDHSTPGHEPKAAKGVPDLVINEARLDDNGDGEGEGAVPSTECTTGYYGYNMPLSAQSSPFRPIFVSVLPDSAQPSPNRQPQLLTAPTTNTPPVIHVIPQPVYYYEAESCPGQIYHAAPAPQPQQECPPYCQTCYPNNVIGSIQVCPTGEAMLSPYTTIAQDTSSSGYHPAVFPTVPAAVSSPQLVEGTSLPINRQTHQLQQFIPYIQYVENQCQQQVPAEGQGVFRGSGGTSGTIGPPQNYPQGMSPPPPIYYPHTYTSGPEEGIVNFEPRKDVQEITTKTAPQGRYRLT